MIPRWTFEAMAVTQFRDNEYEKKFFEAEQEMSAASYKAQYLIPDLQSRIDKIEHNYIDNSNKKQTQKFLQIISNEIVKLSVEAAQYSNQQQFKGQLPLDTISNTTKEYLDNLSFFYAKQYRKASKKRDKKYNDLQKTIGKEGIYKLFQRYYNKGLANYMLNNYASF